MKAVSLKYENKINMQKKYYNNCNLKSFGIFII